MANQPDENKNTVNNQLFNRGVTATRATMDDLTQELVLYPVHILNNREFAGNTLTDQSSNFASTNDAHLLAHQTQRATVAPQHAEFPIGGHTHSVASVSTNSTNANLMTTTGASYATVDLASLRNAAVQNPVMFPDFSAANEERRVIPAEDLYNYEQEQIAKGLSYPVYVGLRTTETGNYVNFGTNSYFENRGQKKDAEQQTTCSEDFLHQPQQIGQPAVMLPNLLPFIYPENSESENPNLRTAGLERVANATYLSEEPIHLYKGTAQRKEVFSKSTATNTEDHIEATPGHQSQITKQPATLPPVDSTNSDSASVTANQKPTGLGTVVAGNYVTQGPVPLFRVGNRNKERFAVQPQPVAAVSPNPLRLSTSAERVLTATSSTSQTSATPRNYVTLGSVSLFEVTGRKKIGYSPFPSASTNCTPESNGTSKNLYRLSDKNKPSYAQVPGLTSSPHNEASAPRELEPVLISPSAPSELLVSSVNSFPIPEHYTLQPFQPTKGAGVANRSSSASTETQHLPNDFSKPPMYFNPAALYTFTCRPNGQSAFARPIALYHPPTPLVQPVVNAAPTTAFPITVTTETNGNSSEVDDATINNKGTAMCDKATSATVMCKPVYHHWFFKKESEGRTIWQPFSITDSLALEKAFTDHTNPGAMIPCDGGRYDVDLSRRERFPVYWNGAPTQVRRCSWFYKDHNDIHFIPFEESIAEELELLYAAAYEADVWNYKHELPNGESVVMIAADVLFLFPSSQPPDAWGNEKSQARPKVVKRGMDGFNIDDGESEKIDHLLFLVHGIGSVCDLKFRTVEQVVDEFRKIAAQLLKAHYQSSNKKGLINRIEVLPISWHSKLHSEDTGIDKKLKDITLNSIPRLRDFTNDTLLDILLYTSPLYAQTIITSVGGELNRIYDIFKVRNPLFEGEVYLGGHSLGSLILYDLLSNQEKVEVVKKNPEANKSEVAPIIKMSPEIQGLSHRVSNLTLDAISGQPRLVFPKLNFQPKAFFAMGSPIAMFLTIRGTENVGDKFSFPTCPAFFNIFHPYDPVAYRIEPLVNPDMGKLRPILIPHHKGRKRIHLELKDTVSRVGTDLKHRLLDSMKTTWKTVFQMGLFGRQDNALTSSEAHGITSKQKDDKDGSHSQNSSGRTITLQFGKLNGGRRIDYVLQESPFEIFNEYIFALTSHVCYWESEDTILLILKEIYKSLDILPDTNALQLHQIATGNIQWSPTSSTIYPNTYSNWLSQYSMEFQGETDQARVDPTRPLNSNTTLGPPPMGGFIKPPS